MGRTGAEGMAEQVSLGLSLRTAVSWHLTCNHYPPLPESLVDVAVKAIDLGNHGVAGDDEAWDIEIDLPEGVSYKGKTTARVGDIVEEFHLDSFLDTDDEEDF